MIEKVIVTLRIPGEHWCMDFELPAFLGCADLGKRLLSSLREMDGIRFRTWEKLQFRYKGRILDGDKTFCQYGIWDGSNVEIMQEEG